MRTLGLAFLLLPLGFAAPALKSGKPTYYHATEVGTVLEYEMRGGPVVPAENTVMKETITAVESKGTGLLVTIKRSTGGNDTTNQVLLTETSVANIDSLTKTTGGPMQMLKLPAKANETWESKIVAPINVTALHKIDRRGRSGRSRRQVQNGACRNVVLGGAKTPPFQRSRWTTGTLPTSAL